MTLPWALGRGTRPYSRSIGGVRPPKFLHFIVFFLDINIFQFKWPKPEEKLKFGVGGFGCPNPSLPRQNFVATLFAPSRVLPRETEITVYVYVYVYLLHRQRKDSTYRRSRTIKH